MWHDMFSVQVPTLEKVLRTVLVYLLIAVLLRLSGKRGLAGMNTLDIVVIVLLSNVVQNAIIGNDNSVTGGAVGAVTLVAVNALLNRAAVLNSTMSRLFDGTDTTVIQNGQVLEPAVRRIGLRRSEIDRAVHVQNGDDLDQVQTGRLSPDGQLILTLKPSEQGATKADVDRLAAQLADIRAALPA
ncbi:MAG: hypothetical protein QOD45_877 [Pseudonocardiales bacterium]|jgi:uncharacterized membrane protein YcaP (DUF421 family)|nr:hypothetical protein [Pseudonocardiales bacterium]